MVEIGYNFHEKGDNVTCVWVKILILYREKRVTLSRDISRHEGLTNFSSAPSERTDDFLRGHAAAVAQNRRNDALKTLPKRS